MYIITIKLRNNEELYSIELIKIKLITKLPTNNLIRLLVFNNNKYTEF